MELEVHNYVVLTFYYSVIWCFLGM